MKIKYLILALVFFSALIFFVGFRYQQQSIQSCNKALDVNTCREKYVISVLQKRGPRNAFLVMEELKKIDKNFGPVCHIFAHTIGIAAYPLSLKGTNVFARPISTCDLGYIHGLMMEVAMHKNDFAYANNYCQKLKPKPGEDRASYEQCYHGIGHGIPLYLALNKNSSRETVTKKEVFSFIKESLQICDKFFNSESECQRGVFGGVTSFYTGDHGITFENMLVKDLFDICIPESGFLKKSCYEMIAPALMTLTNEDIKKSILLSKKYLNDSDINLMAQPLGGLIINLVDTPNISEVVSFCQSLGGESASGFCIEGYSASRVGTVSISDFNKDVLSICDSISFNKDQRKHCRIGALSQARSSISVNRYKDLCNDLEPAEKSLFCKNL